MCQCARWMRCTARGGRAGVACWMRWRIVSAAAAAASASRADSSEMGQFSQPRRRGAMSNFRRPQPLRRLVRQPFMTLRLLRFASHAVRSYETRLCLEARNKRHRRRALLHHLPPVLLHRQVRHRPFYDQHLGNLWLCIPTLKRALQCCRLRLHAICVEIHNVLNACEQSTLYNN